VGNPEDDLQESVLNPKADPIVNIGRIASSQICEKACGCSRELECFTSCFGQVHLSSISGALPASDLQIGSFSEIESAQRLGKISSSVEATAKCMKPIGRLACDDPLVDSLISDLKTEKLNLDKFLLSINSLENCADLITSNSEPEYTNAAPTPVVRVFPSRAHFLDMFVLEIRNNVRDQLGEHDGNLTNNYGDRHLFSIRCISDNCLDESGKPKYLHGPEQLPDGRTGRPLKSGYYVHTMAELSVPNGFLQTNVSGLQPGETYRFEVKAYTGKNPKTASASTEFWATMRDRGSPQQLSSRAFNWPGDLSRAMLSIEPFAESYMSSVYFESNDNTGLLVKISECTTSPDSLPGVCESNIRYLKREQNGSLAFSSSATRIRSWTGYRVGFFEKLPSLDVGKIYQFEVSAQFKWARDWKIENEFLELPPYRVCLKVGTPDYDEWSEIYSCPSR